MVTITRKTFLHWLMTIDTKRLKNPAVKAKIAKYQSDACDVLDAAFDDDLNRRNPSATGIDFQRFADALVTSIETRLRGRDGEIEQMKQQIAELSKGARVGAIRPIREIRLGWDRLVAWASRTVGRGWGATAFGTPDPCRRGSSDMQNIPVLSNLLWKIFSDRFSSISLMKSRISPLSATRGRRGLEVGWLSRSSR